MKKKKRGRILISIKNEYFSVVVLLRINSMFLH